jgi:hypothetical protein
MSLLDFEVNTLINPKGYEKCEMSEKAERFKDMFVKE